MIEKEIYMAHNIKKGTVVQLHPTETNNPMFAGCLLTVTLVRPWGVHGYVQALGENGKPGGQAYYRAKWVEFKRVGEAPWIVSVDT